MGVPYTASGASGAAPGEALKASLPSAVIRQAICSSLKPRP